MTEYYKMVNDKRVKMTGPEAAKAHERAMAAEAKRLEEQAFGEIDYLKSLETHDRLVEAILGTDKGWLAENRAKIAAEEEKNKNK